MHEQSPNQQEVAIFGGSFDPPTVSHVDIMHDLLSMDYDEVWVMPSGDRIDKEITTGETTRLAMLGLIKNQIFNNEERLKVSDFELKLPKPTITVNTHDALTEAFPNTIFTYVIGADSYKTLPQWHDGIWLMENLNWIVYTRDGFNLKDDDFPTNFRRAENEIESHSSTQVRELVAEHKDFDHLVLNTVASFIKERKMYV